MSLDEKTTVPFPSVGADGEQPIYKNSGLSIADDSTKINNVDFGFEEIVRNMQRYNDPAFMPTFSMNELYETVYESRPPIIDGLLYAGTYLIVGAPKVGKSFLMAQLAYHISMGHTLWNYPVRKGTVLYLALEDTPKRLQERLFRMYGTDSSENLHFTISAKKVGMGWMNSSKALYENTPTPSLSSLTRFRKSENPAVIIIAMPMIMRLSESSSNSRTTINFASCWCITRENNRQRISLI